MTILAVGSIYAGKPVPPPTTPLVPAIVYSAEKNTGYDLILMNQEGTQSQLLLSGTSGHHTTPRFSPDKRFVIFVSDIGGRPGIYAMKTDGSVAPNLVLPVSKWSRTFRPDWSSREILLYSEYPSGITTTDLWVTRLIVDIGGRVAVDPSAAPANITNTPAVHEVLQSWSRDGLKIAVGTENRHIDVYDFNPAQMALSNFQRFDALIGGDFTLYSSPTWTTVGNSYVLALGLQFRPVGSLADLWFIDFGDPGAVTPAVRAGTLITSANYYEVNPSWSPDGAKIVFQRESSGTTIDRRLLILNNAQQVMAGAVPAVSTTVATAGGKIPVVAFPDWK